MWNVDVLPERTMTVCLKSERLVAVATLILLLKVHEILKHGPRDMTDS